MPDYSDLVWFFFMLYNKLHQKINLYKQGDDFK